MANISISARNLSKNYGKTHAIKEVDFDIKNGEIVGILGPNGAGKSTILRILGGLTTADSGTAIVCGLPVADNSLETKKKIGFMQENNPLPEELRVREYLKLRAELKEIPKGIIATEVRRVMDLCDLFRTARRKIIRTLSKGFKQRVGIADALIGSPDIIILDEPTIGLDPHQIQGIRKLIDMLRTKHTVLISSHILSEIEKNCDRVIIINHGRVVAEGTKQDLADEFVNENRLFVTIEGNATIFSNYLDEAMLSYEIDTAFENEKNINHFTIQSPKTFIVSNFIRAIENFEDCNLLGIYLLKPDLESIFLAATKRSWEEVTNH